MKYNQPMPNGSFRHFGIPFITSLGNNKFSQPTSKAKSKANSQGKQSRNQEYFNGEQIK